MHQDLEPKDVGIYITSDTAEADPSKKIVGQRQSHDQFGFDSEKDIIDFIQDNATLDDFFIIYTYDGFGIMSLLWFGTKEELSEGS